ncbi:MAG: cupredoxin domain-containing protein, partial [Actinomycetota bacterium]
MSVSEILIVAGALALTGLMGWFFFGPKKSRLAEMADGVQVIAVTVKGGYSPDVIQVAAGVPVRMVFDRQESGDCTSRVVFPDFGVNQTLPAYGTTAVEFLPKEPGEFEFACGMNMIRGRLQVVGESPAQPETAQRSAVAVAAPPEGVDQPGGSVPGGRGDGATGPGTAEASDAVQTITVTVKDGYNPETIQVALGVPVRILFDRQESSGCSSRVLIPAFGVNQNLPAFETTAVEFLTTETGQFEFTCGMGMLHGRILVGDAPVTTAAGDPAAAEEAERKQEIADITRRVVIAAVLTAPVLLTVMLTQFFAVTWVPGLLLNRWTQLALIAPVMFYAGWPIHRTGWLAL